MPLREPPVEARSLANVPAQPLAGVTVFRVWRPLPPDEKPRPEPWWFASVPNERRWEGGRFDLPAPMGTCYFATRPVGAVIEHLQALVGFAHFTLPADELRARRLAQVAVPADVPGAARLTSRVLAGWFGVTAALWAGPDRALTQRWAAAFRRDGWWALYSGLQHDPSGRLRGFAVFDHAGDHPPTLGGEWTYDTASIVDDEPLVDDLSAFGLEVREPGDLPFIVP